MKHDAALDGEVPQIRRGKRVGEHLHVADDALLAAVQAI